MKQISMKRQIEAIAANAVWNEKTYQYESKFEGRVYTFTCTPEEFVKANSNYKMPSVDTWSRKVESSVQMRQKALNWLWNNKELWIQILAYYRRIGTLTRCPRAFEDFRKQFTVVYVLSIIPSNWSYLAA